MIKKLFGPINRWQFFIVSFVLLLICNLSLRFSLFILPYYDLPFYEFFMFLSADIVFIYKRAIDINSSIWKSLLIALSLMISKFAFCILATAKMYKVDVSITFLRLLGFYIICLTLFILFKKGKSNTKPFERKIVVKRGFIVVLSTLVIYIIPYNTGFDINSGMMYPTLSNNDSYLVTIATKNVTLNRGDIVADKNDYRLRRIIGLPNETVEMRGKEIYINGRLFDDKYAFYSKKLEPIHFQKTFKLDNNQYLLIGDNRYFTESGKILGKNKEGVESWRPLREKSVYMVVPKENLVEKVVGIHYLGYDRETKKWKSAGFAFAFNGETFEHNFKRRSIFDRMFLKEN